MIEQKYQKGERVRVNIGHPVWSPKKQDKYGKLISESDNWFLYDINPSLTEDIATVEYTYGQMSETDSKFSKGEDGYKRYSLKFDKHGSIAWFDEENIILVNNVNQ